MSESLGKDIIEFVTKIHSSIQTSFDWNQICIRVVVLTILCTSNRDSLRTKLLIDQAFTDLYQQLNNLVENFCDTAVKEKLLKLMRNNFNPDMILPIFEKIDLFKESFDYTLILYFLDTGKTAAKVLVWFTNVILTCKIHICIYIAS